MEWLGNNKRTPQQVSKGGGSGVSQKTEKTTGQKSVHNLTPTLSLQVSTGFKLSLAMDMVEEMTGAVMLLTNEVLSFCFSYHLKCVCKSNCGGWHAHM